MGSHKAEYIFLDVINGQVTCPKCGRVVRVNVKRRVMNSHTAKGSRSLCNNHFYYDFNVISLSADQIEPKKKKKARPAPNEKKSDAAKKSTTSPARINKKLERDYPVGWSGRSIRTVSGGLPGSGKNRKH